MITSVNSSLATWKINSHTVSKVVLIQHTNHLFIKYWCQPCAYRALMCAQINMSSFFCMNIDLRKSAELACESFDLPISALDKPLSLGRSLSTTGYYSDVSLPTVSCITASVSPHVRSQIRYYIYAVPKYTSTGIYFSSMVKTNVSICTLKYVECI